MIENAFVTATTWYPEIWKPDPQDRKTAGELLRLQQGTMVRFEGRKEVYSLESSGSGILLTEMSGRVGRRRIYSLDSRMDCAVLANTKIVAVAGCEYQI